MKAPLLLLAATLALSARAAPFTNSASADAFLRAAAPTLNYGGAGSLSVSGATATNASGVTNGASDSFIRFNTAAMVSSFNTQFGPGNWVVNSATLQVTEMGAPTQALFNRGTGAFTIRWIANDGWTEGTGMPNTPTTNGISFNDESNLLTPGTDAILGTFTNTGVDGNLSFPMTLPPAFVNDLGSGGEVGLFLTAVDPGIGFTFNSRSFSNNAARPVLKISAVPRPALVGIQFSGPNVILSATNGVAGGSYFAWTSTNINLPLSQWQPVATNVLSATGAFSFTNLNGAPPNGPSPQFYIILTH